MSKPKVIVTRAWPKAVEQKVSELFDATLNTGDTPLTVAELQDALKTADAVLCTVTDKMTAEVLGVDGKQAKILGNFGVGFNNIDIETAKAEGLVVSNTPEVLTDCTADLAMTLLLSVARRAGEGERHLRGGQWTGWRPTHMMGAKVTGKRLGIVGLGRIAQAVARKAHFGFDMKISYYDPYLPDPDAVNKALDAESRGSVEDVLADSDFVSLHCPATPETRHLMNPERFKAMQSSAFLINTARGDVVDEAALVAALNAGDIAGAGLDVFEREPNVTKELTEMENVVLLPHLGSATLETREGMGFRVVTNVEAFFAGKEPPDRVA
jgi:lactate dehydrogenase-like 2-hydroxyacid dehydrogenase